MTSSLGNNKIDNNNNNNLFYYQLFKGIGTITLCLIWFYVDVFLLPNITDIDTYGVWIILYWIFRATSFIIAVWFLIDSCSSLDTIISKRLAGGNGNGNENSKTS